jgi:hypothetical protein
MSRRRQASMATLGVLLAGIAPVASLLSVPAAGAAFADTAKPRMFTRENYAVLASNPDRYRGARVDISGKIFVPPQVTSSKRGITLQAYMDPKNATWNTVVGYAHPGLRVGQGDYIHVVGTVRGKVTSKNASGVTVNVPAVTASSVKKTDATAAASLPVRVATVSPESSAQNGVTVAVTTAEFAPDETRVFVTVENASQVSASFSSANAKAMQSSQQVDAKPNLDYPQIASEIKPGASSSGIVVFAQLDPRLATRLVFQVSQDPGVQFAPFIFDIASEG